MTVLWYVVLQGRQQGPYTGEQIRQFIDRGALQPEDLIWHAGLEAWTRADQVPGLLSVRSPGPPAPAGGENIAVERDHHGSRFWAGVIKIFSSIRIRPYFRINWVGIAVAVVIILAVLALKLLGD